MSATVGPGGDAARLENILIYTLPRFCSYGLNFLVLPILTRFLSPEDFGVVALATAFGALAAGVLSGGASSAGIRFYFQYRGQEETWNQLFCSLQAFLLFILLISAVPVYTYQQELAQLIAGERQYGAAIFVSFIAAFLGQLNALYLGLYENMERAATHSMFTVIQSSGATVSGLLLVLWADLGYMGIVYGSLAGAVVSCIAMMYHSNRGRRFEFDLGLLIESLVYGIQIVPKTLTGFLMRFIDRYLLGALLSVSAVGIYSIGQTVVQAVAMVMSHAWKAYRPPIYRIIFEQSETSPLRAGRLFSGFALVALFPLLLLLLFVSEALYVMMPPTYYAVSFVVVIVGIARASHPFGTFVGVQFSYAKRPIWIVFASLVGLILNVACALLLIPPLGIVGAALASALGLIVANGIVVYIGQKLAPVSYEWPLLERLGLVMLLAAALAYQFGAPTSPNPFVIILKLSVVGVSLAVVLKSDAVPLQNVANWAAARLRRNSR